ncbi:MAG TPA: hypothetical protein VMX76_01010 [Nevskiaceae bacterium]|nr:hypothetical protein [Nevskiaceae bacterium]
MNERLSSAELYDAATAVIKKVCDRKKYIQETLIPRMDERRGRLRPLAREEIVKKLFSVDVPKPGEAVEIIGETVRAKRKLTPELALEIADIIYYTLQPNCPDFISNPKPFISGLGVDMGTAFAFCALKYETRLLQGDFANHKEVEKEIMARFLESLAVSEAKPQS